MTSFSVFLLLKKLVLRLILWAVGVVVWRALHCLVKKGMSVLCVNL